VAGLSREIAEWAASLKLEDIPPATIEAAKTRLLDTLAVSWAGSDAEGIEPLRQMLVDQGVRADSTVFAYGNKLPAGAAALLNSAMGASLDFDGLHEASGVHTDIVVLPAALALAEKHGASGKDLLTAMCAGEEVLIRLGLSAGTGPGWFFSSVFGVFAAAIAAGKILGLNGDDMNAAMGVALCHASGSQQNLVENRLTKRFQSGFAAQAGVVAAEMAAAGIGGPLQSLEGKFGVNTLFTPIDPAVILEDLGTTFHVDELTLKKYPSSFCNHAAIEAALHLANEHNLGADDIQSVNVTVSPFIERVVGEPFDGAEATQVTAQFNIAYSIACALHRRRFTLADIEIDAIRDPKVSALAGKVVIDVDPSNENRFAPIELSLQTVEDKRFTARVEELPGTPSKPIGRQGLLSKAAQCFAMGVQPLSAGQIETRIEKVRDLETMVKVGSLLS
jgi:2-methylcitrate dehydratase PrpD